MPTAVGTTRSRAGVRGALIPRRRAEARQQAGHAVNPSLGARSAHPCASRSCLPPCSDFGQFPAAAEREQEFKIKRRSTEQNQKQCQPRLASTKPDQAGSNTHRARRNVSRGGGHGRAGPLAPWARRMRRAGWARTPNPGLAVCAGQRTRARRHRAPMDGFTACPARPCPPPPLRNGRRCFGFGFGSCLKERAGGPQARQRQTHPATMYCCN